MKKLLSVVALASLFSLFSLFSALGSFGLVGCAKPQAPQLTPTQVAVVDVSVTGFDMRVKMDAFNPNSFPIDVRKVVAHVIVDGTQDLGTVTSTKAISLPANAHTAIEVPLSAKWNGLASVATLAQTSKPVPYTVDGTATIGGESLNVDVPFKLTGTITPVQMKQAALKSLQAIPGLEKLQGLGMPAVPTPPPAH